MPLADRRAGSTSDGGLRRTPRRRTAARRRSSFSARGRATGDADELEQLGEVVVDVLDVHASIASRVATRRNQSRRSTTIEVARHRVVDGHHERLVTGGDEHGTARGASSRALIIATDRIGGREVIGAHGTALLTGR